MLTKNQIFIYFTTDVIEKYNLTTRGIAMIVAQCDHETMGFRRLVESFKYNSSQLLETFPNYFTEQTAIKYSYDKIKIANIVYGHRMGNRGLNSGDGYLYRGRGWPMITGLDMYRRCGNGLGLDLVKTPELLESYPYAFNSALWCFEYKNILNKINCESVTLALNGGRNGLEDREQLYKKYVKLLGE